MKQNVVCYVLFHDHPPPLMRRFLIALFPLLLGGCLGLPENIEPVRGFELERYLGKWYEIARLDHSFERGLEQVTAEYSLREDGGVRVLNRGYSVTKGAWKEAEGRAYFVEEETLGYLKVSFFGPFYGSYIVFELDEADYQYALVAGPSTDYLWLLSRTPTMDAGLMKELLETARSRGFDTDKLIIVNQDGTGRE
ncbi:MAG: lipocalin family protein [Opitutaceae bacterium]